MCVYMYMRVCIFVCPYLCIQYASNVSMYLGVYHCVPVCVIAGTYACMYVCVVWMYVCVCVYRYDGDSGVTGVEPSPIDDLWLTYVVTDVIQLLNEVDLYLISCIYISRVAVSLDSHTTSFVVIIYVL